LSVKLLFSCTHRLATRLFGSFVQNRFHRARCADIVRFRYLTLSCVQLHGGILYLAAPTLRLFHIYGFPSPTSKIDSGLYQGWPGCNHFFQITGESSDVFHRNFYLQGESEGRAVGSSETSADFSILHGFGTQDSKQIQYPLFATSLLGPNTLEIYVIPS
jgi:hypothetical protein